ncbi:hypothetical protein GCM10009067_40600 [Haloarcula sebkhae]|uniref:Uncharacterized protein n=1 Tax=Haloarcula sebkhae TaxID=932660 RepID=A0A830EQJ3_9EURY|nr:hypothetical protein GCM10009067_40600 [Haloarcula sebkhae]
MNDTARLNVESPLGRDISPEWAVIGMNGGGEPDFLDARTLQYSPERWWA